MWYNLCPWFRTGPARYAYIVRYVPMPEGPSVNPTPHPSFVVTGVRTIKTLPSSPYFPETAGDGETRVVRRSYGIEIHYHQAGLLGVSSGVSILAFIIGSDQKSFRYDFELTKFSFPPSNQVQISPPLFLYVILELKLKPIVAVSQLVTVTGTRQLQCFPFFFFFEEEASGCITLLGVPTKCRIVGA